VEGGGRGTFKKRERERERNDPKTWLGHRKKGQNKENKEKGEVIKKPP